MHTPTPYSPPLEAAVVPDTEAIVEGGSRSAGGVSTMPIPVTIPRLGWNMEEGRIRRVAEGRRRRPCGRAMRCSGIEGEKATEEIESLDEGTLHIPAGGPKPGDRIAVGAVIGYLLRPGEATPESSTSPRVEPPDSSQQASTTGIEPAARARCATRSYRAPRGRGDSRRLAASTGRRWRGTGRDGRVRERDVAAVSAAGVKPLTPLRQAIAARMVESRQTTAPVTLTSVVDATNLVDLRGELMAAGEPGAVVHRPSS